MDVQTYVAVGLALVGSPVVVEITKRLWDSYKGRSKARRAEVAKALTRAESYRRQVKLYRHSMYRMDEAFAVLRVVAINHGVPTEEIPPWPNSPQSDSIDLEDIDD